MGVGVMVDKALSITLRFLALIFMTTAIYCTATKKLDWACLLMIWVVVLNIYADK